MALDQAIDELARMLDRPCGGPQGRVDWARSIRTCLSAVREDLREDPLREASDLRRRGDGWLDARGRVADRERRRLLRRLCALGPKVLERPDADTSMRELRRITRDLVHYRQRVHDLVYDAVALELGGSE